jgi:hypothetical protein
LAIRLAGVKPDANEGAAVGGAGVKVIVGGMGVQVGDDVSIGGTGVTVGKSVAEGCGVQDGLAVGVLTRVGTGVAGGVGEAAFWVRMLCVSAVWQANTWACTVSVLSTVAEGGIVG